MDSNHATNFEPAARIWQRHPEINKIARRAIWHIFLTSLNAPYFASKTEKFAVSASLRSAPSVARRVERSGTGGGANEKSTPIGVLSVGSPCWTRTSDTLINSQVLYRLS